MSETPDQAIDRTAEAFVDAFNRKDAAAVGALFREDAEFVNIFGQVLEDQGKKGRLLVPGRFLTGDPVSDHPALVTLKLKGWLAPALKDHVEPLRTACEAARTASCAHDSGPDEQAPHVELEGQTIQT